MTKDSIIKAFTPKYHALYPIFEKSSDNLIKATGRLKVLFNTKDLSERKAIIIEIGKLEKEGNRIAGEMYSMVNSLIINPFDREDVNKLFNRLDELLHHINQIGKMTGLMKISACIPVFNDLSGIVSEASGEIASNLKRLKNINSSKNKIAEGCKTINQLEKKAEEVFYDGVDRLFTSSNGDMVHLATRKKVMETFLKCFDEITGISESIRTILIKAS
jgi:predicted phosphate transport protein (TIGR00153 family)